METKEKSASTILRRRQVEARTGLSRSSIYGRMDRRSPQFDPSFPKPVDLGGGRAVGWIEAEVEAWIQSRINTSRGEPGLTSATDAQGGQDPSHPSPLGLSNTAIAKPGVKTGRKNVHTSR